MAARTFLTRQPDPGPSSRRKYLSLLGSPDLSTFEDEVVKRVLNELRKSSPQSALPVRLSTVADRFLIKPKPEMIEGNHDGEIDFHSGSGMFVIKLCQTADTSSAKRRSGLARLRFTYAHEMAHRFFFIPNSGAWIRAVDAVLAGLPAPLAMKERITIGRIEEGVCNNIARRLLMPHDSLVSECKIDEWFIEDRAFSRRLANTARKFGVSLDCLLVRLQRASQSHEISSRGSYCVFVIALSRGHVLRRGDLKPRVITALLPETVGDFRPKRVYPGFTLDKFGQETVEAIAPLLSEISPPSGRTKHLLTLAGERQGAQSKQDFLIDGWWQILSPERSQGRRLVLWGKLS